MILEIHQTRIIKCIPYIFYTPLIFIFHDRSPLSYIILYFQIISRQLVIIVIKIIIYFAAVPF